MNNKIVVKKLGDLADIIPGVNISSAQMSPEGTWSLIRGRNINNKTVLPSSVYVSDELAGKKSKSTIVPGDILISSQFEQYKIGIVPQEFPPSIAANSVIIIRSKNLSNDYLAEYLTSQTGRNGLLGQLAQVVRGGVIKFITKKELENLDIPILPIELLHNQNDERLSKLQEMSRNFEKEILNYVKLSLIENGWDSKHVVIEKSVAGGIRADIILTDSRGVAISLIEIKRAAKNPVHSIDQVIHMANAIGVKRAFLVGGDGIKEIDPKTGEIKSIVNLPSEKELSI